VVGVDYGLPQVREQAFAFCEEVCRNYDVDGIELDFFRHAFFFRCSADNKACGPAELAAMTGLLRRIRAMAEAEGRRRGRPILVAIRVPDSVDYCRYIGLDLERWLGEGLTDLLIVTGYTQLNPWNTASSWAQIRRQGLSVAGRTARAGRGSAEGASSLESYRGERCRPGRAGWTGSTCSTSSIRTVRSGASWPIRGVAQAGSNVFPERARHRLDVCAASGVHAGADAEPASPMRLCRGRRLSFRCHLERAASRHSLYACGCGSRTSRAPRDCARAGTVRRCGASHHRSVCGWSMPCQRGG